MIPVPRPAPEETQRCLRHHRVMASCQACAAYLHTVLASSGARR